MRLLRFVATGVGAYLVAPFLLLVPANLSNYPLALIAFAPAILLPVLVGGWFFVKLPRLGLDMPRWLLGFCIGSIIGGIGVFLVPRTIHSTVLAPTPWEAGARLVMAGALSGLVFALIAPRRRDALSS